LYGQSGDAVHPNVGDSACHSLVHVHEAVLDVPLREQVALEPQAVGTGRYTLLRHIVQ